MRKSIAHQAVMLSLLLLAHQVQAQAPAEVRIEKGIAYLPTERAEKADLYLPPKFEEGKKYPGVLIIHAAAGRGANAMRLAKSTLARPWPRTAMSA